jgi:GntR family transcriptional regulator/MocR family aminotransferase
MRAHELNLSLEDSQTGPVYLRVGEVILKAIQAGRIQAGQALPGVRELAERLDVNRNTVLSALRELEDQGWIVARPRSGFFVVDSPPLPRDPAPAAKPSAQPGFDVPEAWQPITSTADILMDLSDGVADARLAPMDALAKAYPRAIRLKGPALLQTGEFQGLERLRKMLAGHLAEQRALVRDPGQILLIRSTSMAVMLVAQALIGPESGDVAVENPGHPLVWATLRQGSPAPLHGIPVDAGGLRLDALEALLAKHRISVLVLTPQCHFPTGAPLAADRRARLLALARQHRFAILELDSEYDYLASPNRPLAVEDSTGQVLYAGSLSRLLAPGVRLSFLVVPEALVERFAKARQRLDWQGDPILEWAVSELFVDGEITRHLRRVRKASQDRLEALGEALRFGLAERIGFDLGHTGMGLWVHGQGPLADPMRFQVWVRAAGLKGIKLRPGAYFDLDGQPRAATRLGFTAFTPEELQRAVSLLS